MLTLDEINLNNKVVLLRADLNVPIVDTKVTDDSRIKAVIPTIEHILNNNAGVIVLSHLGRPQEGEFDSSLSLQAVKEELEKLLNKTIVFKTLENLIRPNVGEVILLENTRFNVGEKANSEKLAKTYAKFGDVFVMDAFASAHRAEASTVAIANVVNEKAAGLLLAKEINSLNQALNDPAKPVVVIIGGAKVSTKFKVLDKLANIADKVIVGGGIANTFIKAKYFNVGKSLVEDSMIDSCLELLNKHQDKFILPTDVIVATKFESTTGNEKNLADINDEEMILDLGPDTSNAIANVIKDAKTIIWNGALGVFENPAFKAATFNLANAIANSNAFSLAGGGETLAAINQLKLTDRISYLSTGGGAFLEFAQGDKLPAVEALD